MDGTGAVGPAMVLGAVDPRGGAELGAARVRRAGQEERKCFVHITIVRKTERTIKSI